MNLIGNINGFECFNTFQLRPYSSEFVSRDLLELSWKDHRRITQRPTRNIPWPMEPNRTQKPHNFPYQGYQRRNLSLSLLCAGTKENKGIPLIKGLAVSQLKSWGSSSRKPKRSLWSLTSPWLVESLDAVSEIKRVLIQWLRKWKKDTRGINGLPEPGPGAAKIMINVDYKGNLLTNVLICKGRFHGCALQECLSQSFCRTLK